MNTSLKTLTIGAATVLAASFATGALAQTPWQYEQARRAEIRMHHQDRRIHRELRRGEITPWQARQMHRQAHGYGNYYGRGYYRPY